VCVGGGVIVRLTVGDGSDSDTVTVSLAVPEGDSVGVCVGGGVIVRLAVGVSVNVCVGVLVLLFAAVAWYIAMVSMMTVSHLVDMNSICRRFAEGRECVEEVMTLCYSRATHQAFLRVRCVSCFCMLLVSGSHGRRSHSDVVIAVAVFL
jgi:hypothetical protein